MRRWILKLHRWAGLGAFLWLMVLGVTGIVMNHHEWRWSRQLTVTSAFASEQIMSEQVNGTRVRQFAVNPGDEVQMVAGGERGLWRTLDGGRTWDPVAFAGAAGTPMVLAVFNDAAQPWRRVWLGTDDGIWALDAVDGRADRHALQGELIGFLSQDRRGRLLGVSQHSRVFTIGEDEAIRWLELPANGIDALPDISLTRLLQDWHIGHGLFAGSATLIWNDIAGVAIVVLGVTGFLYWWFPRRWRRRPTSAKERRRSTLRWLFRLHGPTLGLVALIPIVTLSISGIFLDHARALARELGTITLPQLMLPGGYDLSSLSGEVHAVIPGATAEDFSIATRLGLVSTGDGGRTWRYDPSTPMPIQRMAGHPHTNFRDGVAFMGSHGGPNYVRTSATAPWTRVEGLRMLYQDAQRVGDRWMFKSSRGFYRGDLLGAVEPYDFPQPEVAGMPIGLLLEDLHTGLMISPRFVWINDLAAILAIFLSISGFVNWWYRKWL